MVRDKGCKRTNTKTEHRRQKKHRPPDTTPSESSDSQSSVSLSDSDFTYPNEAAEEDTVQSNAAILVSLTDLESTQESDTEDSKSSVESIENEKGGGGMQGNSEDTPQFSNEAYQQKLPILRCRYRAELERIEEEIASAENCYFGTRRTRVGSILKGYGDYASGNVEMTRNRKYCKAVKLSERVFSLSSRSSRIHKEYEEECKKEVMRRDAQLAVGYGYMMPGADPNGLDGGLGLQPRLDMDCYPSSSQGVSYNFNMGGKLPHENAAFVQQFPSYLYTPQNTSHVFMNYEPRPQMPIQGPQMMGPSMRIERAQQPPYLTHIENPGKVPNAHQEYQMLMKQQQQSEMKRESTNEAVKDDEIIGGDNFNVEQYFNEVKSASNQKQSMENGH
eukprot:g6135.t1